MKKLTLILTAIFLSGLNAQTGLANGQSSCFSKRDKAKIINSIPIHNNASSRQLHKESHLRTQKLCKMYKKHGWLTKYNVGQQGAEAAWSLSGTVQKPY